MFPKKEVQAEVTFLTRLTMYLLFRVFSEVLSTAVQAILTKK